MKKTKLVLLTVLLLLVLYCGAVVFVTKPDSFAYEALFSGIESVVSVPTAEQKLAAEQAQRDAISAEIEAVSSKKASAAVNEAVMMSGLQTEDAIKSALSGYEQAMNDMVEQAVVKAFADTLDADVQAQVPAVVQQVTANIEAGIDYYIPQIVDATIPALLEYEDQFAQMLYEKYGQQFVELVMAQLAAEEPAAEEVVKTVEVSVVEEEPAVDEPEIEVVVEAEPVAEEPAVEVLEMSQEEYEAIRQQTRDTEINAMLDQLHD